MVGMVQTDLVQRLPLLAERALIYEVMVNPKPGLVDPVSAGAHQDMDAFTFVDSATALRPYFTEVARLGAAFSAGNLQDLFAQIRPVGVTAEKTMFATTQGINTHKGAIFSLGVLVAATAWSTQQGTSLTVTQIMAAVRTMLHGLTANDFTGVEKKDPTKLTAGEREYLKYGFTGIRGEAEAGFPAVTQWAVPYLRDTAQGTRNQRLLDTFMVIVAHTRDSNVIKRAGTAAIVPWVHEQVAEYFRLGGAQTPAGVQFLTDLNNTFMDRNLSLGGSADLLILTIYLGLVFDWLPFKVAS
jgi:triphosphoribosyl-dephospho-CoA synthase